MPNRLTRVPESPPPTLDNFRWIVKAADLAMGLFYSTPASGTLRMMWVTPATLWISYIAAAGCILIAFLIGAQDLITLSLWAVVLIIVVCGVLALSCAAIALTGTLQRLGPSGPPWPQG
jgi:purine-cytosine permease-like protein